MTFALALTLLWKATLVLAVALVAVRLARHARASVRHGVLVATFALGMSLRTAVRTGLAMVAGKRPKVPSEPYPAGLEPWE